MLRAKREQEEIKRDKLRGDLVHRAEAKADVASAFALIRDNVVSISDQVMTVVPDVVRPQVRSEVQRVIDDILTQIAQLSAELSR